MLAHGRNRSLFDGSDIEGFIGDLDGFEEDDDDENFDK